MEGKFLYKNRRMTNIYLQLSSWSWNFDSANRNNEVLWWQVLYQKPRRIASVFSNILSFSMPFSLLLDRKRPVWFRLCGLLCLFLTDCFVCTFHSIHHFLLCCVFFRQMFDNVAKMVKPLFHRIRFPLFWGFALVLLLLRYRWFVSPNGCYASFSLNPFPWLCWRLLRACALLIHVLCTFDVRHFDNSFAFLFLWKIMLAPTDWIRASTIFPIILPPFKHY